MKKNPVAKEQRFFDINRFPSSKGILVFGISMSRIANAQDAERNWSDIEHLVKKIHKTEGVGLTILYSDYLYMHTDEAANKVQDRLLGQMLEHKKRFIARLSKKSWYIPRSFSFLTYGQAVLNCKCPFIDCLRMVENLYTKDKRFQAYVLADVKRAGRSVKDRQAVPFVLNEIVMLHLLAKGQVELPNGYINHHEKWILNCYPGKPLCSEVYLSRLNLWKLKNTKNRFEDSFYDLEGRKLYNYGAIDLARDQEIFA